MLEKLYKSGFLHLFSGNFIVLILSFIQQFALAYFLTTSDFGLLKLMMTYIFIGQFFAVFGLHIALAYFVAKYTKSSSKFYSTAILFSFFISILSFISLYLLNFFDLILSEQKWLFYWYLVVLFAEPMLIITNTYLQALQKYKSFANIYLSLRFFMLIFSVLFVCIYGLNGFILAIVLYTIITILTLYFLMIKKTFNHQKISLNYLYIILNYSKYSFFTGLFGYLGLYSDLILLNYFKISLDKIGHFSFMQIFAVGIKQISSTIGQFYLPKLIKSNSENKLLLFDKLQKINYVTIVVIFVSSLLIVPYFIEYFFIKYNNEINLFYLLFIAGLFNALLTPYGIFFQSIGDAKINFYNSIFVLVVNTTLNFILIYHYGLYGAAIATLIAFFVGYIYFYLTYKRIRKELC